MRQNSLDSIKYFLYKIFINHFLIALLLAIVIIALLPPLFSKYQIELVGQNKKKVQDTYYYDDLNTDGNSEKIVFSQFQKEFFSLIVFKSNKVINQWNFNGKYLRTSRLIISNIGNRRFKSLYFFLYRDNKIFLECLNPFQNKILTKDKYITQFIPRMQEMDISIDPLVYYDSNNDGTKEFYFNLNTGYSVQPRGIYKYDPLKDTVISFQSYASFYSNIIAYTTNDQLEFMAVTNAVGNSKPDRKYSDMFSWLMNFNADLKFSYKPEEVGFYPSMSNIIRLSVNNKNYFVYLIVYYGTKNHPCILRLIDNDLHVINEKLLPFSIGLKDARLQPSYNNQDYFYIVEKNGMIGKMDTALNVLDKKKIPGLFNTKIIPVNIDKDNADEYMYVNMNADKLVITRQDFSDYAEIVLPDLHKFRTYALKNSGGGNELIIETDNYEQILSYGFNYFYYLKYPFYAGIYLCIVLFLVMIEKIQRHRAELKYETEKRIAELQLKAVKNQIDPHFTLNIINSIGSLFYKEDKEKADYVFGKYSRLLRSTILNSDKIASTLEEELDYVKNYLELEKYRNGNSFNWIVKSGNDINENIRVPRMLIHTFVENAIKHGLRHREKDGELMISVSKQKHSYLINIHDNGVGRNRASEIESGNTGRGLNIMDQILDLYYNLMKTRITYSIKDLKDNNNNSLGTEVDIVIPVN